MIIHELTQEIGERFSEALPSGEHPLTVWRRMFVQAAINAGWVEGAEMPTLMRDVTRLYNQLSPIWREANELPNA